MSKGINLNLVERNNKTERLFSVAERTGSSNILSMQDALSYFTYLSRFEKCRQDAMCEDKIARFDGRMVYEKDARYQQALYKWLSVDEQQAVMNRAKQFMDDARALARFERPICEIGCPCPPIETIEKDVRSLPSAGEQADYFLNTVENSKQCAEKTAIGVANEIISKLRRLTSERKWQAFSRVSRAMDRIVKYQKELGSERLKLLKMIIDRSEQ